MCSWTVFHVGFPCYIIYVFVPHVGCQNPGGLGFWVGENNVGQIHRSMLGSGRRL